MVFRSRLTVALTVATVVALGSPAVPASAGAQCVNCFDTATDGADFFVGAPGEGLARGDGAGTGTLFRNGGRATEVYEGKGVFDTSVPGIAEAGDGFATSLVAGDFDGDGAGDLAIGIPGEDIGGKRDAGSVVVLYARRATGGFDRSEVLHQDIAGVAGSVEAGDRFGFSLAVREFGAEQGYDDLVIGVPGEDVRGAADAGMIHVIPGSANGLDPSRSQAWHQDSAGIVGVGEPGDQWGYSLATSEQSQGTLAVGVPFEDVGSVVEAGLVHILYSNSNGLSAAGDHVIYENTPGITGVAERGDRFGFVLAAGDVDGGGRSDLAIGVPYENIGSAADAGVVQVVSGTATGFAGQGSRVLRQGAGGLAGSPELGDRFGLALAVDPGGSRLMAIGVPGEDLGGQINAGGVHVLSGSGLSTIHQGTSGIAGINERNDEFGAAVAFTDQRDDGDLDLLIGAPGEDFGAGRVWIIPNGGSGFTASGHSTLAQGEGPVVGTREAGDRFGATIVGSTPNSVSGAVNPTTTTTTPPTPTTAPPGTTTTTTTTTTIPAPSGPITIEPDDVYTGRATDRSEGLIVSGRVNAAAPDAIARMDVTIEHLGANRSWNGDSWVPGVGSYRLATADDGHVQRTGYSVRIGTADISTGSYRVTVSATSVRGRQTSVGPVTYTVAVNGSNPTGPVATILRPFDGVPQASDVDLVVRGYASDGNGVSRVAALVSRRGQYWNGSSWTSSASTVNLPLTNPNQSRSSFSLTIPKSQLQAGDTIDIELRSTDGSGNQGRTNSIPRPKGVLQNTTVARIPIYGVAPGAVRVWALGDSITQQGTSWGQDMQGYRYFLDQRIESAGCHVDWVGSLDWNWSEDTQRFPNWTDQQHDGLAAWAVYQTNNYQTLNWSLITSPTGNTPGYDLAAATGADIALIHLGTNGSLDVTQNNNVPGMNAFQAAEFKAEFNTTQMRDLLDDVQDALRPGADIFLAQIINSHRPTSAPVPPLNTPQMINTYINQGYRDIVAADSSLNLVDMASGYSATWNLDGLHPGNVGAQQMSNRWFNALANTGALSNCL